MGERRAVGRRETAWAWALSQSGEGERVVGERSDGGRARRVARAVVVGGERVARVVGWCVWSILVVGLAVRRCIVWCRVCVYLSQPRGRIV